MLNNIDINKMNRLMEENEDAREIITRLLENHHTDVAMIAHEIRNPLTLISSSLQVIEAQHPEVKDFYNWKQTMEDIRFIGNVEARDVPRGAADVVVADGFSGNILLKTYEGVAKMMAGKIKAMFKKNPLTMLSYLGVKSGMEDFRKTLDYKQYGGAPILGVQKPVIKAHGSSDAYAFQSALRQAALCVEADVPGKIREAMQHDAER